MRGVQSVFIVMAAWLLLATNAQASKCTAYCVCNGTSSEICEKKEGQCEPPATALCQGANCGTMGACCCSEQVLENGAVVIKLTDCLRVRKCFEMCGPGSFLVHGEEEPSALLQKVNDSEDRARRARLADWALVEIEMVKGRKIVPHPIYGSSTGYAMREGMNSGIEHLLSPGQSTRILLYDEPPGSHLRNPTVDQDGLQDHLLELLRDQFRELRKAKMALTVVLDLDGQVESIDVLYSEPMKFAEILVPELWEVYATYAAHDGNGRTMDVFSPSVHSEGAMLGLHSGGSYLLDVHPSGAHH